MFHDHRLPRGIVSVRADTSDPKAAVEALNKAWAEFKANHEEQLKEIKAGFNDVVKAEKLDRINKDITALNGELDALNKTIAALKVGGGGKGAASPDVVAHATAFDQFFRKGIDAGLKQLEVKAALRTDSESEGGALVPEEMADEIDRVVGTVSVMRELASKITISTKEYEKFVSLGGAGYGWVGEREARPETSTPTITSITLNVMEIYANPAATQTLLDDARISIEDWLANEVALTFAEQEGAAFIAGDGNKKPRGILAYPTVANASYAWGSVGYVPSGVAGALTDGSNNGADALINLHYALKAPYRNGASFIMSDAVMGTVRKFKNSEGDYLWAPPTAAAEVATVLGKPVYNDDNMSAIGANAFPIAFGNWARAYLIVDRFGIRVLRDPYTNKPWVHFYTTKRVGGGVQNFEAYKLLKVATS